jgi:hypothetical protein
MRKGTLKTGTRILAMVLAVLSGIQITGQSQAKPGSDDSDWWSMIRPESLDAVKTQRREAAGANFSVLGVDLRQDAIKGLARKLGKVDTVSRGDASTAREQACYRSADSAPSTYLIAEEGEVNSGFYFLRDPKPWTGQDICKRTNAISGATRTDSGIHLGMSQIALIQILGTPSNRGRERISYSFGVRKPARKSDSVKCRLQNPRLSEGELHEDCDEYDLSQLIDARFEGDKLVYFGASTSETD